MVQESCLASSVQELAHSVFGAYFHRLRAALEQAEMLLAKRQAKCCGAMCRDGGARLA